MGSHTQSPTGTTSHLLDHPAWGEQGPQAAEEGARAGDLYMPPLSHRTCQHAAYPALLSFASSLFCQPPGPAPQPDPSWHLALNCRLRPLTSGFSEAPQG